MRLAVLCAFFLTLAGYLLLVNADILFTYWTDQTSYLVYGVARAGGFGRHYIAHASAPLDNIFNQSGFGAMLAPFILARGLDIPLLKGVVVAAFFTGLAFYGAMITERDGNTTG